MSEEEAKQRKPQEFIQDILGRKVAVRVNDGSLYEGRIYLN